MGSTPDFLHWWSRRDLLHLGAGYLGLTLGSLWRAQAAVAERGQPPVSRIRSCILVFLYGGPSHLDTWDLKPNAPAEVRGEFRPIRTTVPGLQISEHLPRMARLMHRVALIRSMHHTNRLHDSASIETFTGRQGLQGDREEFAPIKQFYPSVGSALAYAWRQRGLAVPAVSLPWWFHNVIDVPCQGGGFLGPAYDPLLVTLDGDQRRYQVGELATRTDGPTDRLTRRRDLLRSLENAPPPGTGEWQRYASRAQQLLASDVLRQALDLEREPLRVRERYGFGPKPMNPSQNGGENGVARQMRGQNLLLARRLVEAGVPFVNVHDFRQQGQNWDAHAQGFTQHRDHLLPMFDQGVSALLEDLEARGLLDTTLVVVLGEFGRTPRINKDVGRDHWPDCYSVLLAGGGVRGGTVYGSSDRFGAYPATNPVRPADLAATIYWRFGIDPRTEVHDVTGRPHSLTDGTPIRALFGLA